MYRVDAQTPFAQVPHHVRQHKKCRDDSDRQHRAMNLAAMPLRKVKARAMRRRHHSNAQFVLGLDLSRATANEPHR